MDYLFENLGDERFQEFCNSIIAKEFSHSQSFPVGQPDGGRDSVVYLMNTPKKEFIVFQVKFVRNPNLIPDVHKWLTKIIDDEAEKIDKLIPKGAKQFYLLTNVNGTAHLDAGSKDKVNSILEEKIRIPSICWWRDDLSRLLEKDPIFKWSFPEILNGQDVLNSILFQNIHENKERRENVIRAYLADQYAIDNEVKFRQIDLQNKLFGLFTDVPIRMKKINLKNRSLVRTLDYLEHFQRRTKSSDELFPIEERENFGAANFLLHPRVQNEIERILLEGGPGQGKSTISQYICQVHRVKLLNKEADLNSLPDDIKNAPIRLPFKIDLRHVASWVENKNPYQSRLSDEYFSSIWKNSLESFLVGHIAYHSQIDFTSNDLIAITSLSSILFVFDGFDEIPTLKIREEVIELINEGINRISENSKSIQVIITSRPAAFSDTVGFSVDMYPHFELTDITPVIIQEYVEKWIRASGLNTRESAEIKRLVDEKLQMPHLKELAKSPMQLAIFISLLRTRGESLPNKRTALYDSYIELFFNRESEKSTMIRDHRDLIIDIHQYLAWVLHSESETLQNNGSINIDDLKIRLKSYLTKEGHKTDIADQLFHVVEERVCALVSRVQGTYEFEVQPLREYFCAKYLYNTSPYSPQGAEKTGTKPERFEAISRNFYWQNVVRFFSGCFDKGELPMLIQELKELQKDKILKYTNHPRLLTSQILSDWVFTQYPLLLKDVVKIIIDGINIGRIINQERKGSHNEPILLPNECGRAELITECFEQLKKFPHSDYALELIGIIRNNPFQTIEYWKKHLPNVKGISLTKWLEYAYLLQIIHKMDENLLLEIVDKDEIDQRLKKLQILIDGNRIDILNNHLSYKKMVFDGILENQIGIYQRKHGENSLQYLTFILHPYLLAGILDTTESTISALYYINQRLKNHGQHNKTISEFPVNDEIDMAIRAIANTTNEIFNKPISIWKNSIEPWDMLIENLRATCQERWGFYIISAIAAGIKTKGEAYDDFDDLHNNSKSLCKRVRSARMKSGNIKYWEIQLNDSTNITFTLLVFFTWATPKTISHFLKQVGAILEQLSENDFLKLADSLTKSTWNSKFNSTQQIELANELKHHQHDTVKYIISLRFPEEKKRSFIYKNVNFSSKKLEKCAEIALDYLIEKYLNTPDNVNLLNDLKKTYSSIKKYKAKYYYYGRYMNPQSAKIPITLARQIMEDSKNFPRIIASVAEKACRLYANEHLTPVGEIARKAKWFDE